MASKLLNSGDIHQYQAIGEDGVLVWQKALPFINSLKTSRQLANVEKYRNHNFDEYLAIPRFSQDGKRVDWFIPFESTKASGDYEVVSWNAASDEEKYEAARELFYFSQKLYSYGQNLESIALNSNEKLFAHFLTGNAKRSINPAIHYPDESCIFIVDGRPVITFWGFINKNEAYYNDPFIRIKNYKDAQLVGGKQVNSSVLNRNIVNEKVVNQTYTNTTTEKSAHHCCIPWWLLLLLLLLLLLPLLLYFLWWLFFARSLPFFGAFPNLFEGSLDPVVAPWVDDTDRSVLLKDDKVEVTVDDSLKSKNNLDSNYERNEVIDSKSATLYNGEAISSVEDPNVPADATAVVDPTAAQDPAIDNAPVAPITDDKSVPVADNNPNTQPSLDNNGGVDDSANLLPPTISNNGEVALSNADLSANDISRLNGTWKVNSAIVDKTSNRPINLEYEFKDGKGEARIVQSNGTKCKGAIAGSLNQGQLNISSNSVAKCNDGSSFILPEVKCKAGSNGNSDCVSTYQATQNSETEQFPMSIHR